MLTEASDLAALHDSFNVGQSCTTFMMADNWNHDSVGWCTVSFLIHVNI